MKKSLKTKPLDIIKIVIWAVIALMLIKIAFFPPSEAGKDTATAPDANFEESVVAVTKGDVASTVSAQGVVQQDAASGLKATIEGTIKRIAVTEGQDVQAGQQLVQIQQAVTGEDSYVTDSEGNETVVPGRTTYNTQWVTAPANGKVHLSVVTNQSVNAGDNLGSVQPATYSVVAQLTPDQMYRIVTMPETARVAIKNGPPAFDCVGLKVDTGAGTSSTDEGTTATNIEARCTIPADVRVFPGQNATVTINAGEAKGVLTVPATAIEGRYQKGIAYLPDGKQKDVEIGLCDGTVVEIRAGLSEGDEILEYVPSDEDEGMECDPMTGEGC